MAETCDPDVIDKIVKWVVLDDADAREKFGKAVRGGTGSYQALQDRLTHDQNALRIIMSCQLEAREALARYGFIG